MNTNNNPNFKNKVCELNVKFNQPEKLFDCAQTSNCLYENAIYLLGFEFDGTACFRKGTKAGPNALREVSDGIESYSPYLDEDIDDICFYDLGNLSTKIIPSGNEHKNNEGQSWKQSIDPSWSFSQFKANVGSTLGSGDVIQIVSLIKEVDTATLN